MPPRNSLSTVIQATPLYPFPLRRNSWLEPSVVSARVDRVIRILISLVFLMSMGLKLDLDTDISFSFPRYRD